MSVHAASLAWSRSTPDFAYETYDRTHVLRFGGGIEVAASSAPEYSGDATKVNPEEQLVGAIASCHMLTFLAVAARKRLVVDRYEDHAEGVLEKDAEGRLAITRVTLRPAVRFAPGVDVDAEALARLHEAAHRNCFIANSVRCAVTWESTVEGA
jgi:organic hydroperoxide reductase OsmC/OhrA